MEELKTNRNMVDAVLEMIDEAELEMQNELTDVLTHKP